MDEVFEFYCDCGASFQTKGPLDRDMESFREGFVARHSGPGHRRIDRDAWEALTRDSEDADLAFGEDE